ncbi:MAG: hypothetical protein AAF206_02255 [Bacteroidota bacterium]
MQNICREKQLTEAAAKWRLCRWIYIGLTVLSFSVIGILMAFDDTLGIDWPSLVHHHIDTFMLGAFLPGAAILFFYYNAVNAMRDESLRKEPLAASVLT